MRDSVVWVSSLIVEKIGSNVLQKELERLYYGNKKIGSDEYWIQGPLEISPEEQLQYLLRIEDIYLKRAIQLLPVESDGNIQVFGKTGSCWTKEKKQIGWYVGWAESNKERVVFVFRFLDEQQSPSSGPAGFHAKKVALGELKKIFH